MDTMSVKSATESLTEYIHNTYHTTDTSPTADSKSTSIADGHGLNVDEQLNELRNQFQDGIKHLQQPTSMPMQPSVSMPQLPTFQQIKLKPVESDMLNYSINCNLKSENPRRKLPRPMTTANLLSHTPAKINTNILSYNQCTMPMVTSSSLSSASSTKSNSSSGCSRKSSSPRTLINSPIHVPAIATVTGGSWNDQAIAPAKSNHAHDQDGTHISSKLDLLINILHSQQNMLAHLISYKKEQSPPPSSKKKKKCKRNKKLKTQQKAIQTSGYVDRSVQTDQEYKQGRNVLKIPPIPESSSTSHAFAANPNITLPYSTLIKLVGDLQTLPKTHSQFVYPTQQGHPNVHPYIVPQQQAPLVTPPCPYQRLPDCNANRSPKSTLYFSDQDD